MAIQAQMYQENLGFPLCGSQDWISDINGCGIGGVPMSQFCFNAQPKSHHLHQQQQQQQVLLQELQQSLNQRNDNVWFNTNTTPAPYSQTMFDHVEKKQRREIDQYIKFQNERLILMLQEQRKQQIVTLMKKVEPKLMGLLRDKEEEISRARKRTLELEDLLTKLEAERQAWQRLAQENEATVLSLSNMLEQARERASCSLNNVAEDAESCCDFDIENREIEEDQEIAGFVETQQNRAKRQSVMVCKACGLRNACVLFLPCRHFCSCKDCEGFLDSCPVCREPKKASIEALTF